MLKIRLSRIGKKNMPMYRLIVSEASRDTFGKSLEIIGSYNPHTKDLQIDADRVKHWLGNGAQMSPSINNLLIDKKVIEGEKVKASKPGKKNESENKEESAPAEVKTEEKPQATPEAEAPKAEEEKKAE